MFMSLSLSLTPWVSMWHRGEGTYNGPPATATWAVLTRSWSDLRMPSLPREQKRERAQEILSACMPRGTGLAQRPKGPGKVERARYHRASYN